MGHVRSGLVLLVVVLARLSWSQTTPLTHVIVDERHNPSLVLCGGAGQPCCHAPASIPQSDGPIVTCKAGLGCNLASNTCVSPCGGPGQACCDGPDARAPRWTEDGRPYVPTGLVREMCKDSVCDPASNLCKTGCGMNAGDACCGVQPGVGVATCLNQKLYCALDAGTYASGKCEPCGIQGKPACSGPKACEDGLAPNESGLCVFCGHPGMIVCDRGPPCDVQSIPDPITRASCLKAGGPNEPCLDGDMKCGYADLFCNARNICEVCGGDAQACCPGSHPCTAGVCGNDNRCVSCGQAGMRTCPIGERCPRGGEPDGGQCKDCGGEGQLCCFSMSVRCDQGLRCDDRVCKGDSSSTSPPNNPSTCGGQAYTFSVAQRPEYHDDGHGCAVPVSYMANSDDEAVQCLRSQYGNLAITSSVNYYGVSLSCPYSDCIQRQVLAKDLDSAKSCAASVEGPGSCSVVDSCQ